MRKVIIFHEHHNMSRSQVAQFAETKHAKLFLEGVRPDEAGTVSSELDYPVVPLEHNNLPVAMSPLVAADGTLRLNAFLWSVARRRKLTAANRFVVCEQETAALHHRMVTRELGSGRPLPKTQLKSTGRFLDTLAVSSAKATLSVGPFGTVFHDSLEGIREAGSEGIPPRHAESLRLLAGIATPTALEALERSIFSEIGLFFGSNYGFIPRFTHTMHYGAMTRIVPLIGSENPLSIYAIITGVLARLKELRDMYMAYSVVREGFERGVLDVGVEHALEGSRMLEIIQACGIEEHPHYLDKARF